MTPKLRGTLARLGLLDEVAAGRVQVDEFGRARGADGGNVSYGVNELRVAGLVTRPHGGGHWVQARLTPLGVASAVVWAADLKGADA